MLSPVAWLWPTKELLALEPRAPGAKQLECAETSPSVLILSGRRRGVFGMHIGDLDAEPFWPEFLRSLMRRTIPAHVDRRRAVVNFRYRRATKARPQRHRAGRG